MDLPLTTLEGTLKCHRPENLNDVGQRLFDYFSPTFLRLHQFHDGELKGVFTSKTAELSGRGRERRFAGDRTLDRGCYYALQNPERAPGRFNPLTCEMFAYADPGAEVQPSVFDSTIAEDRQHLSQLGVTAPGAYFTFVVLEEEVAKLPPTIGMQQQNQVIRASIQVVEAKIARVIDLRLPAPKVAGFESCRDRQAIQRLNPVEVGQSGAKVTGEVTKMSTDDEALVPRPPPQQTDQSWEMTARLIAEHRRTFRAAEDQYGNAPQLRGGVFGKRRTLTQTHN